VRIVVEHRRSLLLQQPNDIEGRTLSHVVYVPLVRNAKYQNAAPVDRLPVFVESLRDLARHYRGHLAVDLAGEIDETRLVVERSHLPGEIVGIERNAVSADSRARREFHETERLRRRSFDHFPDVDAELVANDRHL